MIVGIQITIYWWIYCRLMDRVVEQVVSQQGTGVITIRVCPQVVRDLQSIDICFVLFLPSCGVVAMFSQQVCVVRWWDLIWGSCLLCSNTLLSLRKGAGTEQRSKGGGWNGQVGNGPLLEPYYCAAIFGFVGWTFWGDMYSLGVRRKNSNISWRTMILALHRKPFRTVFKVFNVSHFLRSVKFQGCCRAPCF